MNRRTFIQLASATIPLYFFSVKAIAKDTTKEPVSIHLGSVFYYHKHKVQIFENKRHGYGSIYKAEATELRSPVCGEKNKHTAALNVVRRLYSGKNRKNDSLENFYIYIDTYKNGAYSVIGAEMELEYWKAINYNV